MRMAAASQKPENRSSSNCDSSIFTIFYTIFTVLLRAKLISSERWLNVDLRKEFHLSRSVIVSSGKPQKNVKEHLENIQNASSASLAFNHHW